MKSCVLSVIIGIFSSGLVPLGSLIYQKFIAKTWNENRDEVIQKTNGLFKKIIQGLSQVDVTASKKINHLNNQSLKEFSIEGLLKLYKGLKVELESISERSCFEKNIRSCLFDIKDVLVREQANTRLVRDIMHAIGLQDVDLMRALEIASGERQRAVVKTVDELAKGILRQTSNTSVKSNPRILHVSLEYTKAKVGGIAAVTESLLIKSRDSGIDARIVTPFYGFYQQDKEFEKAEFQGVVEHTYRGKIVTSSIYKIMSQNGKVPQYLIKPDPEFATLFAVPDQKKIYEKINDSTAVDRSFYLASATAAMAACYQGKDQNKNFDILQIHVIHELGLAGNLLKSLYNPRKDRANLPKVHPIIHFHDGTFANPPTCTVKQCSEIGLVVASHSKQKNIQAISWLNADALAFVSDQMAAKALDSASGVQADDIARHLVKYGRLRGVTNGINHRQFDITDPKTYGRFAIQKQGQQVVDYIAGKAKIKRELYEAGIIPHPEKPLFFFVGRLLWEKGVDMLPLLAEEIIAQGGQCVIMGTQFDYIPKEIPQLTEMAKKHPEALRMYTDLKDQIDLFVDKDGINTNVSKGSLIRAAGDFCLVPSHFESCGLIPPESSATGNITFTSYVGGLKDVCRGLGEKDSQGNTIEEDSFDAFTYTHEGNRQESARINLRKAIQFYQNLKDKDPKRLNQIVTRIIEGSKKFDWMAPRGAIDKLRRVYEKAMQSYMSTEMQELNTLKAKWLE